MPGTIHDEKRFTASASVRDRVIGMADGLTVPFALASLFAFGVVKGRLTGIRPLLGGLQTEGIGGVAAAAAFGIARWIGSRGPPNRSRGRRGSPAVF